MGRVFDEYIASDKHSLPARFRHKSLGLLGVIVLIQVGNEHVGALARIRDCDRSADSAVSAGDNRLLARQATRATVRLFAMIGHGLHSLCFARHGLFLLRKWRLCVLVHVSALCKSSRRNVLARSTDESYPGSWRLHCEGA